MTASDLSACVKFDLPTRRATQKLAELLAPKLEPSDLLILSGPLGSGKTFFTRALCRALGLPQSARVPSPTFTLVHEHETTPPLSHADLYRLNGAEQVRELGLDAQRDDGRILVVEWGEPYADVLGGDALVLTLTLEPRSAAFSATGRRSRAILAELGAKG
ncbi:MAG TPA: tRNA (adenosine(37)-N6)-threonylcarbamoyltransferase complex ATPase subunit type 1 TsaE [Polyangiaceae bacterium]|nr:tRNA (adenosine(37)-N6)-threonylcarbamoyltransferase complex ATPase subunit type 1 TsaE [Polyangiaceae bacterium]